MAPPETGAMALVMISVKPERAEEALAWMRNEPDGIKSLFGVLTFCSAQKSQNAVSVAAKLPAIQSRHVALSRKRLSCFSGSIAFEARHSNPHTFRTMASLSFTSAVAARPVVAAKATKTIVSTKVNAFGGGGPNIPVAEYKKKMDEKNATIAANKAKSGTAKFGGFSLGKKAAPIPAPAAKKGFSPFAKKEAEPAKPKGLFAKKEATPAGFSFFAKKEATPASKPSFFAKKVETKKGAPKKGFTIPVAPKGSYTIPRER